MSEFSFHKNVSASEGDINFFVTYLAGWGGGVEKISDETGRGQKNFVTQIVDILPETTTLTGT